MTSLDELFVIPRRLLETTELPAPAQRMTETVREGGYLTVSTFLRELSDVELDKMLDACMAAQADEKLRVALALFCTLMANHEGLVVYQKDDASALIRRLAAMVQGEVMARQGLVTLVYERLSLERVSSANMQMTAKGRAKFCELSLRPSSGTGS